jgi:tRNA(fMet)-specific endonuclease VapC
MVVGVKYLLDSTVCIQILRSRSQDLAKRIIKHAHGELGVSTVVAAELYYGAVSAGSRAKEELGRIRKLLSLTQVLPFNRTAAEHYGRLRFFLEEHACVIGSFDLLIASHALSLDVPVVTHNVREFQRVPGLRVETW